jgi:hypothetical protein
MDTQNSACHRQKKWTDPTRDESTKSHPPIEYLWALEPDQVILPDIAGKTD